MGTVVLEEKWPVLGRHEQAVVWLHVWADLGRAPRTMDAYARGLAEYLEMCERVGVDPLGADRAHIASYVRELAERPSRRGANVVSIDSGAGLANATLQQRMVPVRLFYDFLVEEGVRESNPVGRGRYSARNRGGGGYQRGLIPRLTKLPWIPTESQWLELLAVAAGEPVRNRVMLALAYDAACGERSCARCALMMSTRPTGCCGSGRRRRRTGWNGWCPTLRPRGYCCRAISPTGRRFPELGGRCSCRSRAATGPRR